MYKKILIVDDEIGAENRGGNAERDRKNIDEALKNIDYSPIYYESGEKLQSNLDENKLNLDSINLVLLDIGFPSGLQGPDILDIIKNQKEDLPVIMFTVSREAQDVIKAFDSKADDYIAKSNNLSDELQFKVETLGTGLNKIIGFADEKSKEVFKNIKEAGRTDANVFINGETGTGKELVAQAIYKYSKRANEPFKAINCGALTENLLEPTLFGYEKGAFTGAYSTTKGFFEVCNGGTIFLDEIGETSLKFQVRLLRVLDSNKFYRVGGTEEISTNVRIISATNKNIADEVRKNKFRKDLLYRLNVVPIFLPSLRERKEDIPILAGYFIWRYKEKYKANIENIEKDAINILENYDWPGNVRELDNVINRSVMLDMEKESITKGTVDKVIKDARSFSCTEKSSTDGTGLDWLVNLCCQKGLKAAFDNLKTEVVHRAVHRFGNQTKAAEALRVSEGAVSDVMRKSRT